MDQKENTNKHGKLQGAKFWTLKKRQHISMFSKDNKTFCAACDESMTAIIKLHLLCNALHITSKTISYSSSKYDKTFHFRTYDTSHYLLNLLTSFSLVPFEPKI